MELIMITMFLVSWLWLLPIVVCDLQITHRNQVPYQVCAVMLSSSVIYSSPDKSTRIQNYCNPLNQLALGSMAHCIVDNFNKSDPYVDAFLISCHHNISRDQFDFAYNNATGFLAEPPPTPTPANSGAPGPPGVSGKPIPFFHPISLSTKDVQSQYKLTWAAANSTNYSIWFGLSLILYWFAIMLVASIYHWSYWLFPGLVKSMHGPFSNWFRRNIILAPLGSKYHSNPKCCSRLLRCFVPLRFETLCLAGWFIMCCFFIGFNVYQRTPKSVAFAVGFRVGILIIFNIPLLVLFPGRNNFMQWLTGWPYCRFLIFHRWIARSLFLMLIVHAACVTDQLIFWKEYSSFLDRAFIKWGVVGITAVSIIMIQTLQVFRKKLYEIFVLCHILLVVIFIVAGWHHVKPRGPRFMYPYYATISIWGVDRIVRIARLISFGLRNATIKLIDDETLKIDVSRPRWWKPYPGAHAFVYIIRPGSFWQSHPFSIVDSILQPNTISFYIKVKSGVTQRIRNELQTVSHNMGVYKIAVEGPYSPQLPLDKFENVVFIAGGNGIPGLYYEALTLIRKKATKQITTKIKFYWVVKNIDYIHWFCLELNQFNHSMIETVIYITQFSTSKLAHSCSSNSSKVTTFQEKASTAMSSVSELEESIQFLEFKEGRPNLNELVRAEVETAVGAVAFVTCGAECMVDDIRFAVRKVLKHKTSKRVEYFEDIQEW